MGLDMFLEVNRFVWYNERESDWVKSIERHFPELKGLEFKEISFGIGYWRKANAIHKWFVDNVQDGNDDCREYSVDKEQLQELLDICKAVKVDNGRAGDILPTQDGFFFGSTAYDEYYFQDIDKTIEILEKALSLPDEYDFEYSSSW
jgi:hypothetical protein